MTTQQLSDTSFTGRGYGLNVKRAEGAYLITPEGKRVLDAAGGAIVANIGHGRREVAEVAARALEDITYVVPTFGTPYRDALARRLVDNWLPEGLTRVSFVSGGAESVESALRLARQYHLASGRPERWKVIGSDMSYHGVTMGGLSAGHHATRRAAFEPMLIDFPKAPAPYCLSCSLGRRDHLPDCRNDAVERLEQVIVRAGPETVAAVIMEPVIGSAAGATPPPPDYWPRLAEVCRRYDVLLIADEVMSGFGRTGRRFAVEHWGVTPDIMTGGKGLAGGYAPIGGVYASEEVVAPLAAKGDDLMFLTFSAHPAACAVAEKVLEIMEREELVPRAERMGSLLKSRLHDVLDRHPNVAEIRGLGLMLGIELVRETGTLERFPAESRLVQRVTAAGLERGVFFYPGGSGPARDVVMLGPPFIINGEDIDLLVEVLGESIDAAVASVG
ncbi:MAG TPA: aspartate aminotransferase family protein [Dehalococcoidia bacterium]|nr:aspartate aminotransferase family protein [Dehalococcoidia bacterium]